MVFLIHAINIITTLIHQLVISVDVSLKIREQALRFLRGMLVVVAVGQIALLKAKNLVGYGCGCMLALQGLVVSLTIKGLPPAFLLVFLQKPNKLLVLNLLPLVIVYERLLCVVEISATIL